MAARATSEGCPYLVKDQMPSVSSFPLPVAQIDPSWISCSIKPDRRIGSSAMVKVKVAVSSTVRPNRRASGLANFADHLDAKRQASHPDSGCPRRPQISAVGDNSPAPPPPGPTPRSPDFDLEAS